MAFSNTILPNVAPVQAGGPLVTAMNGMNNLQSGMQTNAIQNAQIPYAPYDAYANALLKTQQARFLPYQQMMQSAPMLMMAANGNPALQQQLISMMSNPMNMQGGGGNGLNIPLPGQSQGSNSLLGMLMKKLGMGGNSSNSSQNAMQSIPGSGGMDLNGTPNQINQIRNMQPGQSVTVGDQNGSGSNSVGALLASGNQGPSGYSGMVPSTGGASPAIIAGTTKGYNQQVIDPGRVQLDPNTGQLISAPSNRMATQLQNQVSAGQRVIPQFKTLGDLWKPFMNIPGGLELEGSKAVNLLTNPALRQQMGFQGDLPSQYADAKIASLTSVESYLKSIGVPVTVDVQSKLNDLIEPLTGENPENYPVRIQREADRIANDFITQSKQQLGSGYNVTPGQVSQAKAEPAQSSVAEYATADPNAISPAAKILAKKLDLPNFSSSEDFNNWYNQQPSVTKQAVRLKLGGKV